MNAPYAWPFGIPGKPGSIDPLQYVLLISRIEEQGGGRGRFMQVNTAVLPPFRSILWMTYIL